MEIDIIEGARILMLKHYKAFIIYLFIYMLAFEDNCFCFQVTAFFTKNVKFIQNIYKERPLFDKKTYNWKTKAIVFKSQRIFEILSCLSCLQSLNLIRGSIFSKKKKKKKNYQKIGFPLNLTTSS